MPSYRVTFDGGAQPNPGKGYGSYRIERLDKPAVKTEQVTFDIEPLTNNEAEYLTLIQALHRLRSLRKRDGGAELEIVGDSRLVINHLAGVWQPSDPRMNALCDAACSLAIRIGRTTPRWEKRDVIVGLFGH